MSSIATAKAVPTKTGRIRLNWSECWGIKRDVAPASEIFRNRTRFRAEVSSPGLVRPTEPVSRRTFRPLRNHRIDWRRWHGPGVSRTRHEAPARRRPQGPASRDRVRSGTPPAFRARGAYGALNAQRNKRGSAKDHPGNRGVSSVSRPSAVRSTIRGNEPSAARL